MATLPRRPSPATWLIGLLAAAILLNYIDRGAVGIAAPLMRSDLALSATGFGLAVSAFFWVYAPISLLIGWLCDRWCVYRLLAAGLALWALSTTLIAFAGGLASLIGLRVLLGLGESVTFPGSAKIIAREAPAANRGTVNALMSAAQAGGPAIGTLAGGTILRAYGWRAIFLVFGVATFAWVIPWLVASAPFRVHSASARATPYPMRDLVRLPALWFTSATHFCSNYSLYFLLAWLPLYLTKSRGYSIPAMTELVTATYLAQGCSALLFGWASDQWVRAGTDEGRLRKGLMVGASATIGTCILGAAMARSDAALVILLILAGAAAGVSSTNNFAIVQIFAGPRATGSWTGIQNGLSNLSGIVGPIVTGLIVDSTHSYFYAFAVTAAVSGTNALIWLLAMPRVAQAALN